MKSREVGHSAVNSLLILAIALITATAILTGIWAIETIDLSGGDISATDDVSVEQGAIYLDRSGQATAVGEIENGHRHAITNLTITVTYYEDGEVADTQELPSIVSTIPARSIAPYEVKLQGLYEPDKIDVGITYDEAEAYTHVLDITDVEETYRSQDQVTLIGEVETSDADQVRKPTVFATMYDENGTVIGVRSDQLSRSAMETDQRDQFAIRYSTIGHLPSLAREYETFSVIAIDDAASEPEEE